MPNGQPAQLANLKPPWKPGVQPKPGSKYVERMVNAGCKISPRAMAIIGRIIDDDIVHGDQVPLQLRFRAAELIIEKTWPKAQTGASVTIDGATSLVVRFHSPDDEAPAMNGHAETITMSFDADGD